MGDISNYYGQINLNIFENMIKNKDKFSDKVMVNTADWVSKPKFQDMKERYDNFIKKENKKPNYINVNLGSPNMIKTYSLANLQAKAKDIIAETKRLGRNPDRIHIKNRENGNLDVLGFNEYMGLFENQNVFWVKNGRFPNYTTLNGKANNPVVIDYQNTAYNCGPASLSMISQQLFKNVTEQEFAKVLGTNSNGTDPKNLPLITKLGFSIKAIPRNNNDVKKALNKGNGVLAHIETKPATCLGYLNNYGHYVSINQVNTSQYVVLDPTKGYKLCTFSILDRATNGRDIKYYEVSIL